MSLNPIQFGKDVIDQFGRYLLTTFNLADLRLPCSSLNHQEAESPSQLSRSRGELSSLATHWRTAGVPLPRRRSESMGCRSRAQGSRQGASTEPRPKNERRRSLDERQDPSQGGQHRP